MLRELKEELKIIKKHPVFSLLVIGNITGIIPAIIAGIIGG